MFDHKPVTLNLKSRKIINRNIIKDTILNNPDLDAYVKCAVFECYLLHCERVQQNNGNVGGDAFIDEHIATLGRVMNILNDIKSIELNMALNGFTEQQDLIVNGKRGETRLIFEDLPDLEFFENLNVNYEPEVFFQTLVSCIKNNVLSHQANIFKLRSQKKNLLIATITDLKKNFTQNSAEVLRTERILTATIESELKDELLHYKKFEMLNAEKITPYFMNLVKSVNNTGNISELKKDGGEDFVDEVEQNNFIHNYYKDIYSQPDNNSKTAGLVEINEFLGPIKDHPIVVNAKLSNEERDELETGISLEELTKSINNANLSSAPGADGISNRFIKHYWDYFKNPLLKLCNSCYEKNEMPANFLSANIKLIPKKGDLSKIKNWRPISLLNCFYKIISRVITARLRKYMDKLTPICQKGYSSTRYCQEVLISIIEGIERCKAERKKGAVISLDIKKAFDSLSHSFLQGVYEFFNFGPVLKKWITLLSTKRRACVILENGKFTEFFNLDRGNAQGDTISPFLFNLGYQILLFKLELSFQIEGTRRETAEAVNAVAAAAAAAAPGGDREGRQQLVSTDPKVAAMADDCTLLVKLNLENLQVILGFLNNYENISGLGCNIEKTSLMPVGLIEDLPQNILELGLQIVPEITLLGAQIKNTGLCFENNGQKILEKIRKQVNFWARFCLSLPGRICVAKTFMYSQINYLGCFMPIENFIIKSISSVIEKFVKGNLKIGLQKFYDPIKNGGLGLFNVSDYLASQCCAWVRRSSNMDDLWKRELLFTSYSTVFNLRSANIDSAKNPILKYIAKSYEKFLFNFTSFNENYLEAFIYDNPSLPLDANHNNYVKRNFFDREEFALYKEQIHLLTIRNLVNPDLTIKTKENFEQQTGVFLPMQKFEKLCRLANNAVAKHRKLDKNEQKTDSVKNFCMRIRKGSKRYRKIITGKIPAVISTNMTRYSEILDQVINLESSVRLNGQWGQSFLDNSTRTFIFKLHNNLLGINTRVAHFVRNHSRTCTFCTALRDPDDNPESILHLFFECEPVENMLVNFFEWLRIRDFDQQISPRNYFQGFNMNCENKNRVMDLITVIVKKYIWDCKQRFTVPNLDSLKLIFVSEYSHLMRDSQKVRKFTHKSKIFENHIEIRF